jgi:hypothetical protein
MPRLAPAVAALALVLLVSPAAAQNFGAAAPEQRYFEVNLDNAGKASGGRLSGSVHNLADYTVTQVRVLVEGLDGNGQPVSQALVWVLGDINEGGRRYFTASAPSPGVTYRATVHDFRWGYRGPGL